jgi:hypothetical protein
MGGPQKTAVATRTAQSCRLCLPHSLGHVAQTFSECSAGPARAPVVTYWCGVGVMSLQHSAVQTQAASGYAMDGGMSLDAAGITQCSVGRM